MAVELDPERTYLRDELRRSLLPLIVHTALQVAEIQDGIEQSNLTKDAVAAAVLEAPRVVITVGPEFEAVYQLALGKNLKIDKARLAKELDRNEWSILWGLFYEARTGVPKPETLSEALSAWCTVVLRDRVVPEVRRVINALISDDFSTTLHITAVPGLQQANDISFAVTTRSTRNFLSAIARTHGNGAIGLAGPRGTGKSTLIQQYVAGRLNLGRTRAPSVAVSVDCPVNYEARDFVLHLHAVLCQAVLKRVERKKIVRWWHPSNISIKYASSLIVRIMSGLIVGALALAPMVSIDLSRPIGPQLLYPANQFSWWMFPLILVAAYAGLVVASGSLNMLRMLVKLLRPLLARSLTALISALASSTYTLPRRNSDSAKDALGQLARAQQRQIKMLQTLTSGWSGKFALPLAPEAAATKSIQFTERPLTYPEIVDSFRDFASQCVETIGPVVVAIDEVDKIATPEKAQAFINEIKSIFGVSGCLYLVSISEEAVVTFERTGLGIRDAFDSAFDEIVHVEYLNLADSLELLNSRVTGISEPFGFLCHCLSGGLPRELIRTVRRIAEYSSDLRSTSLATICHELVRDEITMRAHQFRVVANRLSVQHGTAVLEPLIHLPLDPSIKDLLKLTTGLTRRQISGATSPALERLRREAAMLVYHGATLKQIFTNNLDKSKAEHARAVVDFPGSFDQLSRARRAVTEDPHLAGLLLDEFRNAWGLPSIPGR